MREGAVAPGKTPLSAYISSIFRDFGIESCRFKPFFCCFLSVSHLYLMNKKFFDFFLATDVFIGKWAYRGGWRSGWEMVGIRLSICRVWR